MNAFLIIATLTLTVILAASVQGSDYGDSVGMLPVDLAAKLAEANAPNESGAMGRNKKEYFHVRFQRGMHHIAEYGLASKRTDVTDRFLTATEYSLQQQLPSGDFKLVIPSTLEDQGHPSIADRASGVAFFAASLGLGIYALESSKWFANSPECDTQRRRLVVIKPKLESTLAYLVEHREFLELADRRAPNRLLFDALAFVTLGKILNDAGALEIGSSFVEQAAAQVHDQDGYFIEGGGHDSSYNGVATALAFRLLMLNCHDHNLEPICLNAIRWQKGRVLATGEISTKGNTRVRPGDSGESFLGREKDVDVGHTVEALMLASQYFSDPASKEIATRIVKYYEDARR